MKNFSSRLKQARKSSGMTQEQLGFALGVSKSSISAWEHGRDTPSFKLLKGLRDSLGLTLDELVCGICGAGCTSLKQGVERNCSFAMSVRDDNELSLLVRFRRLSNTKKQAILELMKDI